MKRLILTTLIILIALPCYGQVVKIPYDNWTNLWIERLESSQEWMLDGMFDEGYIQKTAGLNYWCYLLLNEEYPEDVVWHQLSIDLPERGHRWFAFRGDDAVEPIKYDMIEIKIRVVNDTTNVVTIRNILNNLNPGNFDLHSSLANNNKIHATKAHREEKLKDKRKK